MAEINYSEFIERVGPETQERVRELSTETKTALGEAINAAIFSVDSWIAGRDSQTRTLDEQTLTALRRTNTELFKRTSASRKALTAFYGVALLGGGHLVYGLVPYASALRRLTLRRQAQVEPNNNAITFHTTNKPTSVLDEAALMAFAVGVQTTLATVFQGNFSPTNTLVALSIGGITTGVRAIANPGLKHMRTTSQHRLLEQATERYAKEQLTKERDVLVALRDKGVINNESMEYGLAKFRISQQEPYAAAQEHYSEYVKTVRGVEKETGVSLLPKPPKKRLRFSPAIDTTVIDNFAGRRIMSDLGVMFAEAHRGPSLA